jgi:ABC-2 type transport system permease protein
MFERIQHMLIKEFIQVLRDPRLRIMAFLPPIMELFLFGYAATTDVRNIRTAVYDLDNSVQSRALVARFVESGYFEVVANVSNDRESRELLDRSEVQVVLRMNKGFGEELDAGRTAQLQVILDGTDSNTAGIVLNYSSKIAMQFSQNVLAVRLSRLQGALSPPPQVALETRAWFNENLESRNFFIPGVISLIVMIITLSLTSMAIVREKEIGTIEQIMVSPIRPWELIIGKTVPFVIIAFIDVVMVTVIGVLWFEVPMRGNLLVLAAATILYLLTTLGVGLFISTISRTQQQAMMSTFFFVYPAVLLSGFVFPIANMPEVIRWITYLNPLRYFLVILRGIFLKGVGVSILWPQMVALAILGAATLWLAVKRFHKTLA